MQTDIKHSTTRHMPTVYSLVRAINSHVNYIMKFIFSKVTDVPEGWDMVYCHVRTEGSRRLFY